MRKVMYMAVAVLMVCGLTASWSPARAADVKLGYVDLQSAITKSDKGKAARAKMNELVEQKKGQISKLGSEIEELQSGLEKQGHLFTEDARRARMSELDGKQREYSRLANRFEEDLKWYEQDLVEQLTREIRPIIEEVGKRDGFQLIFEYSPARYLYVDKTLDVTDKVVDLYNKRK